MLNIFLLLKITDCKKSIIRAFWYLAKTSTVGLIVTVVLNLLIANMRVLLISFDMLSLVLFKMHSFEIYTQVWISALCPSISP